jgi:hypothetical protein
VIRRRLPPPRLVVSGWWLVVLPARSTLKRTAQKSQSQAEKKLLRFPFL